MNAAVGDTHRRFYFQTVGIVSDNGDSLSENNHRGQLFFSIKGMSATEQFVFKMVNQFYRDTQAAVRTALIADFIGKDPRTVRYILCRLETKQVIARRGQRGGWLPASRLVA